MRLVVVLVLLQLMTGKGLSSPEEWARGPVEHEAAVELEQRLVEEVNGDEDSEPMEKEYDWASSLCRRCHSHAQCETRPDGGEICRCKHGFYGNGITVCADVDECAMDDICGANELCQNSPGSYKCKCRMGFTRRRGRCVDSQAKPRANTTSTSQVSSYPFSSRAANTTASTRHTLPSSGPLHDVTTRISNCTKCHNNAMCEVATGKCFCNSGYQGNGISLCQDTNECVDSEICGKMQTCHNTPGSFKCTCPEGFQKNRKACVAHGKEPLCPAVSVCGVSFLETPPHTFQNVSCYPNSTGFARYYCTPASAWHKNGPNFRNCTNQSFVRLTAFEPTRHWISEMCGDLALAEDAMLHMGGTTVNVSPTNASAEDIVQMAVSFVASLLPREPPQDWAVLPSAEAAHFFSRSLANIDKFTSMVAARLDSPNQDVQGSAEGNEIRVISLATGVSQLHFIPSGVDDGISLSVNNTELKPGVVGAAQVLFGYNPHVHSYLPPLNLAPTSGSPDPSLHGPLRIISAVVSATLLSNALHHVQLKGNVTITLRLLQDPENQLVLCGFWVERANTWDTLGCEVTSLNNSHAQCSCSHLTHFAILLAHRTVSEGHALILTLLTRVTLSVSLLCLALSVATFTLSRALHGARNSVHTNLCVTLFIAELIFLLGVQQTGYPMLCKVVAYFLHYFFLAAFTWMSLEGVCLYFMVVQVFRSRDLPVRWLYTIGYGLPLVILILTLAIAPGSHGTDQNCWLDKSIYWSFAGPVLFVITTNLGFLGVTMYKMIRHRQPITPGVSCMETIRVLVLSSLALTFLLGVPWVFALFYISDGTAFLLYVFTVFAALQGLFIYIFHCLLQKKVRDEYVRMTRRLCGYTELVRSSHSSSSGRTRGSIGNGFGTSFKCEETNIRSEGLQPSFTENGVGGHLETFTKPRAE